MSSLAREGEGGHVVKTLRHLCDQFGLSSDAKFESLDVKCKVRTASPSPTASLPLSCAYHLSTLPSHLICSPILSHALPSSSPAPPFPSPPLGDAIKIVQIV